MKPFGLNILGQYVKDSNRLQTWVHDTQPAACLVMDNPALAQTLRTLSPSTLVIHRSYHPQDSNWQAVMSPAEWLNAYKVNGPVLQVFNEPGPAVADVPRFLDWLISLMRIATAQNYRLVVGNFAVGTPNEKDIQAGVYDRLLQALAESNHILGLHEYFNQAPLPDSPYLCGRFKFWIERAHSLGISRPEIVITEHGHDLFKGGFQTGLSSTQVFIQYLREARTLYQPYGIATCTFCYGYGANNQWVTWDIEDTLEVLAFMQIYQEQSSVPTITPVVTSQSQVHVTNSGVRMRDQPSLKGNVLRTLTLNTVVTLYTTSIVYTADGYVWRYVKALDAVGWAAESVNSILTFSTPLPNPAVFEPISPLQVPALATSPFGGVRTYPGYTHPMRHEGVDLVPKVQTCSAFVVAIADGVVDKYGFNANGYGNYLRLDHGGGWFSWVGHLRYSAFVCDDGQSVKKGDIIGIMGSTGNATGPHVHLTLQHIGYGLTSPEYVLPDVVDPLTLVKSY